MTSKLRSRVTIGLGENTKFLLNLCTPAGNQRAEVFQILFHQLVTVLWSLSSNERLRVMRRIMTGDIKLYLIEEGGNHGNPYETIGPGTEKDRRRMAKRLNRDEAVEAREDEI